ncbi:MAG TPA: hypothetical protein VMK84_12510 [Streptosporangiaceae bacterium]|nr:hypothetical protein [Streptosporangiaceae bacterium]
MTPSFRHSEYACKVGADELDPGLAMATTPAAFARALPPPDCCTSSNRVADAPVTVITAGGMPGWQITLIALGAALVAAIAAVTLDRALATRRSVSSTTA